jgi:hypothetical protein
MSNASGTLTSKAAPVTFSPIKPTVCGQWNFKQSNLAATAGYDLAFLGGAKGDTAAETRFGTTRSFGIPDIGNVETAVMAFPACSPNMGYVLTHDAEPNGRGAMLNQYTLVADVLWQNPNNQRFSAILQIDDPANLNDADLFISWTNSFGGIGISEHYEGNAQLQVGHWHRIAIAMDMDTSPPVIVKFIDGVKQSDQIEANGIGRDGRFSLRETALLFTDENGETTPGFVSSIQLHNTRLSDLQIQALGGPSPDGIQYLETPRY